MKKLYLIPLFSSIILSGSASAQTPIQWHGYFKGDCELISPKRGAFNKFLMSLEIKPLEDDKSTWTITYGEGPNQNTRPYELLTIDAELGHYAVDENNGLVIDQYLVGNQFISMFEIGSSKIQGIYALNSNGTIDVSLNNFSFDPVREAELGPYKLGVYGMKVQQKCRLFKW
ncbi:hypothetical protein [Pseudoalteromonas denitrificans]|jgi:hypothetical protein|uniref:Uncharacterized protein n=1 Tax=Pseudoalteromonas denitrificans DSM 6059 TaxID=1123010 RepID=A0A1I1IJD4_9GAMM|nr:hypothetical protein [Pseudoalteromonas denitrificans]SFC36394.1 hypothetical protein SAMN02745724_01504 [Pseudoalteromonas denitrificans DSM 6059]